MKHQGIWKLRWLMPLSLLILLELFKFFPGSVERWYSATVYPRVGETFRKVFGGLPFSTGDLLVAIGILLLIYRLVRFMMKKQNGKWKTVFTKARAGKIIRSLTWLYIAFHLFWGLNYYRLGSAHLLDLELQPYTQQEVDTLMQQVQRKLEYVTNDSAGIERGKTSSREKLGEDAFAAYRQASRQYAFMYFENMSLKPILLGKLQAYAGYAGYIFPFTGEAQADFYVPNFTLPFTVCHEMAHQIGFGAESEANLIGFLAARESSNPAFVYSAYAGIHQYALFELYKMDSLKARPFIDKIPSILKKDREEQMKFSEAHTSFLQPALDAAYTIYLQGNNQPLGLQSYNRVVAWLIAYGKKYGWEKI